MNPDRCPAILVHGWKSHPGVWNHLVPRLRDELIPTWIFDHTRLDNTRIEVIAGHLGEYIDQMRKETRYSGQIDIVCHSMGTCLARYMLEVLDRTGGGQVRQLIGIGPPNHGSALAELFNHPEQGPVIIKKLSGTFVPNDYDPAHDVIVQQFRPGSKTMVALKNAGLRTDITYRIICAANPAANRDFFPPFDGKTWELSPDGSWQMTLAGDGIVANSESRLSGAGFDVLPADGACVGNPDQYCHIRLPRTPEVVERVVAYLKDPGTVPSSICP
jgi:pimeloyl-ACP methyl ester carboxylesterase